MKVHIDNQACQGHGLCYMTAPELVGDDEAGFGTVLGDGTVPAESRGLAERAVALCPERALILEDSP